MLKFCADPALFCSTLRPYLIMQNDDCIRFLRWALPQIRMRWPGFRKVRVQICKRIDRRLRELNIADAYAYKAYLEENPHEWSKLDKLCYITVSRFYRDKAMFNFLAQQVIPDLARRAIKCGENCLKVWSAGCASGEEPYTANIIWLLQVKNQFPDIDIRIVATDSNSQMIQRALQASYTYSSVKNLPLAWRENVFVEQQGSFVLKAEFRHNVQFLNEDIRQKTANNHFDLVLCRNLVFTYFQEELQCEILQQLQKTIVKGGVLVIGIHENLPACNTQFSHCSERLKIYKKI